VQGVQRLDVALPHPVQNRQWSVQAGEPTVQTGLEGRERHAAVQDGGCCLPAVLVFLRSVVGWRRAILNGLGHSGGCSRKVGRGSAADDRIRSFSKARDQ
jgi:hypothetical protein